MAVQARVETSASRREAADLVGEVFSILKESLTRGERVLISGFGRFDTRDKNERMGRNPVTGAPVLIESRRVIRFKPSDVLKDRLNGHD